VTSSSVSNKRDNPPPEGGGSERGNDLALVEAALFLSPDPLTRRRLAKLLGGVPQQDIPRPVLRTLAVIAYNQPITQADLVRVRGNKAYGHVQELIERRLIRAEEHERTLLLHVTGEFLRHFGLSSPEEFRFHAASGSGEEGLQSGLEEVDDG